jgi:hypothetical protein
MRRALRQAGHPSDSAIGCEEALDCWFFVDEKRWADSHGAFWRFWADLERILGLSEVDVYWEEKVEAFGGEPGSRGMP